jgi:hypothetical protein
MDLIVQLQALRMIRERRDSGGGCRFRRNG